jgi:hypothetical protein
MVALRLTPKTSVINNKFTVWIFDVGEIENIFAKNFREGRQVKYFSFYHKSQY